MGRTEHKPTDWAEIGENLLGLLALALIVGGGVTIVVAIWLWLYPLSIQLILSAVFAIFIGAVTLELMP